MIERGKKAAKLLYTSAKFSKRNIKAAKSLSSRPIQLKVSLCLRTALENETRSGVDAALDFEAISTARPSRRKNTPCGEGCGEDVSRGWMMPSNPLI